MVVVLWAHRRLRLRDALVFLLTLLAVMLPALAGGKPLASILSIYTAQTGLYTGLTYNAPSLFGLLETAGLDVYAYGNFGMALAFGACALLVLHGLRAQAEDGELVRLALLMALVIVFLLPRMHERYFYLAGVLSVALAARRGGRAVLAAALIELASLSALWAMGIALNAAAMLMLAAVVLSL